MRINLYSIYDSKASAFAPPFFMLRDQEAIRAFADTARDPQTRIAKHPSDYTLHRLGTLDDQSGFITACPQPEYLAAASEFVGEKQGDKTDA